MCVGSSNESLWLIVGCDVICFFSPGALCILLSWDWKYFLSLSQLSREPVHIFYLFNPVFQFPLLVPIASSAPGPLWKMFLSFQESFFPLEFMNGVRDHRCDFVTGRGTTLSIEHPLIWSELSLLSFCKKIDRPTKVYVRKRVRGRGAYVWAGCIDWVSLREYYFIIGILIEMFWRRIIVLLMNVTGQRSNLVMLSNAVHGWHTEYTVFVSLFNHLSTVQSFCKRDLRTS